MLKAFRFSVVVCGLVCSNSAGILADDSVLELFKRRITPILRAPNASSCTECHLSGVELKDYIGETQEQTFASLNAAGLIDMDHPDESKLLRFIQRAPDKPTPMILTRAKR